MSALAHFFSCTQKFRVNVALFLVAYALTGPNQVETAYAAPNTAENRAWNVNFNTDGSDPSKYYGSWEGHQYYPSSDDWRKEAVYHILTDRFYDGDPKNNDLKFGGYYPGSIETRHGGDFKGLESKLDYLQGLGITAIWISSIFQTAENEYHGYGQIDYTLIDARLGTLEEFRNLVQSAHKRGIYVYVDIVVNHLNNYYYFEGFKDGQAPFRLHNGEYRLFPRNPARVYEDFLVNNQFIPEGHYPTIYNRRDGKAAIDTGGEGSFWNSDFHHNGVLSDYADPWNIALGKIYNIYDDLRTTHPRVQDKIIAMTQALITSTDIDGIRVDTPMQVPLSFFKRWVPAIKGHAAKLGKKDFFVFGEFYCSRGRAATMIGRGMTTSDTGEPVLIDDIPTMDSGIDYGFYKGVVVPVIAEQDPSALSNPKIIYDLSLKAYDFWNPVHKEIRYQMLNFFNSHDQRRLATWSDGLNKTRVATALLAVWPGIPLYYYGDEQGFSTIGSGLDGHAREGMMTSIAWKNYGSILTPNPANFDSFNMTSPQYLVMQRLMEIRRQLPALYRGLEVYDLWTHPKLIPGVSAFVRGGDKEDISPLVVFNLASKSAKLDKNLPPLIAPWPEGTKLVDLLDSTEKFKLGKGGQLELGLKPYDLRILVPEGHAFKMAPRVVKVSPSHDESLKASNITINIDFDAAMGRSILNAISFDGVPVASEKLLLSADKRRLSFSVNVGNGIHFIEISPTENMDGLTMSAPFQSRFRVGNEDSLIIDTGAQVQASLINNGELTTRSRQVKLYHRAPGATYLRYSSLSGFGYSPWEPYQDVTEAMLKDGNGWREIKVQYWADGSGAYFASDGIDLIGADGLSSSDYTKQPKQIQALEKK